MNTLQLKSRKENRRNILFYDYLIDGTSLYDLCKVKNDDRVGSLGWSKNFEYGINLIKQFLGLTINEELKSGRIMAFVCAECGHIGCGATTFKLTETETEVIWSDFGYENNYETEIYYSGYERIGPFRLEKLIANNTTNETTSRKRKR